GGAFIAFPVLRQAVEVEVTRGVQPGGGDDVPARPPAADVVERGEAASQVVRLVVGGGRGGDQADVLRDSGERGQQDGWFQRAGRAAAEVVPQHRSVGQEQRVEL